MTDMTEPLLAVTSPDGESQLKDYIVDYVGAKLDKEDVTVHMIAEVLAGEFPDFLYAFAEENFIRGYQTGINDVAVGTLDEDGKFVPLPEIEDDVANDWTTTSQGEVHDADTE